MKLKVLAGSLLAFFAISTSASAFKALPTYLAEIEIRLDGRKVAREHPWAEGSPILGRCARANPRRYECQVQISGKRPLGYTYETGIEYEDGFCGWVGIAHLIGPVPFVARREFSCETWIEYSR